MKRRLDRKEPVIRFSVLVGTEYAELKDDRIVGKWSPPGSLRKWTGATRSLSEQFLNCPSDSKSVLQFTRKYGPLESYPGSGGGIFEFSLDEWRKQKDSVRRWWDLRASVASFAASGTIIHPTMIEAIERDQFQVDREGMVFQCANLKHYMKLEIARFPRERLRQCQRDGCGQRFFARDLKEKYCCDQCSAIERNRSKLRYWDKNKKEFLAERHQQRSRKMRRRRKSNGTRKTR